jgi:hypothetical protein
LINLTKPTYANLTDDFIVQSGVCCLELNIPLNHQLHFFICHHSLILNTIIYHCLQNTQSIGQLFLIGKCLHEVVELVWQANVLDLSVLSNLNFDMLVFACISFMFQNEFIIPLINNPVVSWLHIVLSNTSLPN